MTSKPSNGEGVSGSPTEVEPLQSHTARPFQDYTLIYI